MAHCNQGYLCEVCDEEVPNITESDLYLRYVIGEIESRELLASPERHICCNPTLAQFIVDDAFPAVVVEGPFAKEHLDTEDVVARESLVTAGWRRLQEIPSLNIAINEYPLHRADEPT